MWLVRIIVNITHNVNKLHSLYGLAFLKCINSKLIVIDTNDNINIFIIFKWNKRKIKRNWNLKTFLQARMIKAKMTAKMAKFKLNMWITPSKHFFLLSQEYGISLTFYVQFYLINSVLKCSRNTKTFTLFPGNWSTSETYCNLPLW